jgi:O-antigen/teichoic acid export membrane protein
VLQVLAWVGLLQSLQTLNGDILQALDRTSTLLRYSLVFCFGNLAGFIVGLNWGIVGVAAGYAVTSSMIEPLYTTITARAVGVPVRSYLRGLSGVAQAAVIMFVVVLLGRILLVSQGVPSAARLVLLVALGGAVYVPSLLWRAPEVRAELRAIRSGRRGSLAPAALGESAR